MAKTPRPVAKAGMYRMMMASPYTSSTLLIITNHLIISTDDQLENVTTL